MISIISLFLELLFNQIIPKSSYFLSLFSLISLLFIKQGKKYYLYLFILGFLYDIFFTEIIFIHSIIFIFLGYIIKHLKIRNIFIVIILIFLYQIIIFLCYSLLGKINININEFIYISMHYYLLNIIYFLILSIFYKKNHNIY